MDGAKMTADERRALWDQTVSIEPPDVDTSYYERLFAPLDKKEETLPRPDKPASSQKNKSTHWQRWGVHAVGGLAMLGASLGMPALAYLKFNSLWLGMILGGLAFSLSYLLYQRMVAKALEKKEEKPKKEKSWLRENWPMIVGALTGGIIASVIFAKLAVLWSLQGATAVAGGGYAGYEIGKGLNKGVETTEKHFEKKAPETAPN